MHACMYMCMCESACVCVCLCVSRVFTCGGQMTPSTYNNHSYISFSLILKKKKKISTLRILYNYFDQIHAFPYRSNPYYHN